MGPWFFILYVNPLPYDLTHSKVYLYVDDTAIAVSHENVQEMTTIPGSELSNADSWLQDIKLSPNLSTTKIIFFGMTPKAR